MGILNLKPGVASKLTANIQVDDTMRLITYSACFDEIEMNLEIYMH